MNLRSNKDYLTLLRLFIILQPVLDILTTISILYLNTSLTVGIVVRLLFMALSLLFILFGNDSHLKKYIISYLLVLFSVLGIGFIINIFSKPVFNLFLEAQWLAKSIYFSVMLCSLVLLLDSRGNKTEKKMKLLTSTFISLSIVTLTFIFSILSNTSRETYDWVKAGFKGWFYSGNEISAVIAISLPLVILFSLAKTKSLKDYKYWIPSLLLGLIGTVIGTKVGLFAVIGTAIVIFVFIIIHWLLSIKSSGIKNEQTPKLILSILTFAIIVVAMPFTPSYQNLSINIPAPIEEESDSETGEDGGEFADEGGVDEDFQEEYDEQNEREPLVQLDSLLLNKILSSRQIYFTWQYNQLLNANVAQKVFGMGYAGNYVENRKTIEMDFFDIFLSFGILGTILILLPLIVLVITVFKNLFTNFFEVIKIENITLITSILLGLGIALIAGHVWFAPAVNIYLAISMAMLFTNLARSPIK